MEYLNRNQLRNEINRLATADTPFLFLIDFKGERGLALELNQLAEHGISCSIDGQEIGKAIVCEHKSQALKIAPIPFSHYKKGFDSVIEWINHGDTYLLNLTYATDLGIGLDMATIYSCAQSHYKFMLEGQFLFYSPEPFLQISDGVVCSCPMKGTIMADNENAEQQLLDDKKELYEHYTIVDLIRNDMAMIASNIQVDAFRYVESIQTQNGVILQTSSKISGTLPDNWPAKLGDILLDVIPAGSVSGAPKARTVEIIDHVELSPRGFYTGVMGVYQQGRVDSCVIIRYLEKSENGHFYYRSGGGITSLSNAHDEYNELLTKIYVPTI